MVEYQKSKGSKKQHTLSFSDESWALVGQRAKAAGVSKSAFLGRMIQEFCSKESVVMTIIDSLPKGVWNKDDEQRVWVVANSLQPLGVDSGLSAHLSEHPASDCRFIFPKSVQESALGEIMQGCQDALSTHSLDGLFVESENLGLQFMVIFSRDVYSSFIFSPFLTLGSGSPSLAKHLLRCFDKLWAAEIQE